MKRLTDDSAGSGITTQQARAVQLPQNTSLLQPSHAPPLLAAFLAAHRSSASYAAAPSNLAASVPLLRRFVVFAATRHARATSPLMINVLASHIFCFRQSLLPGMAHRRRRGYTTAVQLTNGDNTSH
ncbi:hypothetical protein PVAP13_4NG316166 [Panicum virgatum]|uniref:Uncharacterized protein n=1 Tax=Panicum virgatum TaxID=38727 RepID=A0A8T0T9F7_PANVG|nr:hypothetical protein PVAP13_4NG316166 [Panicum virgatum]KAG2608373.1 hypothetical protein PVAP13_4NG316166 [Panicum virgatum]KAG2608374.1 hypothetical protein PVAP13_4NG316166 [Panicum virgatum]KAG2608375.1 hypothetical protein PVAP13_4NG316166 [Panicum virgatum]